MVKSKASYNVLKAISIGLAASIALMPTATVFADDGDVQKKKRSSAAESSNSGHHKKSDHSKETEDAKQEVSEAREESYEHFNEYHPPVEENDPQGAPIVVVDDILQSGGEQNSYNPADNVTPYLDKALEGEDGNGGLNKIVDDSNAADNSIGDTDTDVESSGLKVITDGNGNQLFLPDPTYSANEDENPYGDSNDLSDYTNNYVDRNLVDKDNFNDGDNHVKGEFETGKAKEASGEAKDKTGKDKVTAGNTNDGVQDAAYNKEYDNQAAADAQRGADRDKLEGIQKDLDDGQKKLDETKEKLDTAKDTLDAANTALDNAKDLAKKAEENEKKARTDYEKLLNDLGPKETAWDYDEEKDKYVVYDNVTKNSEMGKALDNVGTAFKNAQDHAIEAAENVDKAQANADNAEREYEKNKLLAADTIDKLVSDAKNVSESAKNIINSEFEDGTPKFVKDADGNDTDVYEVKETNPELEAKIHGEDGIEDIRADLDSGKFKGNDYKDKVREMARAIVDYYISSIDGTDDINISTEKVDDKFKAVYKVNGEEFTIYFNYKVIRNADGEEGSYTSVTDGGSHILVSQVLDNGKTQMLCSEWEILNGLDKYQQSVKNAREALKDAYAGQEAANSIIDSINKLNGIISDDNTKGFAEWDAEASSAKAEAEKYSKLINGTKDENGNVIEEGLQAQYDAKVNELSGISDLIDNITTLKENIANKDYNFKDKNGNTIVKGSAAKADMHMNRLLAYYLLEYKLRAEYGNAFVGMGEFDPTYDKTWTASKQKDHYGQVTFTYLDDNNEEKTETIYFDYNAYYANGEIAHFGNKYYNSTGTTGQPITGIDVLVKTKGDDGKFVDKGTSRIKDTEFLNDMSNYEKELEEIKVKLANAKNAETYANLVAEKAAAKSLEAKVSEAKEKVEAAKQALLKARQISSVNRELIAELEQKLKDAKEEYDAATVDYQEADDNLKAMQESYDAIEAAVNDYVNAYRVKEVKETDPAPAPKPGPEPDPEPEKGEKPDDAPAGGRGGRNGGGGTTGGGDEATGGGTGTDISAPTYDAGAPAGGTEVEFVADGGAAGDGAIAVADGGAAVADGGAGGGVADEGGTIQGGVLGDRMAPVAPPESKVLGDRMAPISRGDLFTEEGLKIPFMWWIIILILGAKGAMMYAESKKKKETAAVKEEIK